MDGTFKHPLDQLDPSEISKAVEIVKKEKDLSNKRHRISTVDLIEPSKSFVLAYQHGDKFDRKAILSVYIDDEKQLYEAVVDLSDEFFLSWTPIPLARPPIIGEEFSEVEQIVKNSELFQQALYERGISSTDSVWVDPWTVGVYGLDYEKTKNRLLQAMCFLTCDPKDNGYAHPIDGLVPIVDLTERKVICVEEYFPVQPIPKTCINYHYDAVDKSFRPQLLPIEITQRHGPSFHIANNEVIWQHWAFHVGFTGREGLVFHNVRYNDNGRVRPLFYRMALCELMVAYGDPRPQHFRKNVFDVGEYGFGRWANSLKLGCDCLGEIQYLNACYNNTKGDVVCIENAICIHEEDNGVMWKHTNWRTMAVETRRSRRLVVSSISTLGNYEYGNYWYFYTDGSIEFEMKLTGIMHTAATLDNDKPKYGTVIAPNLYAPIHEHFFCFRLDCSIDGINNSVYEVDVEAEKEGPANPQSNAYYPKFYLLTTESEACRQLDSRKHRFWKIVNPEIINSSTGQPVGYRLEPKGNAYPYAGPSASVSKRAGFIKNHLWVTRYDPRQLYPAGKYPNQLPVEDGLALWTSENKPITNTDIVVWYTLGVMHVPRCEDFPVMNVATTGFTLKPDGFFNINPANDVQPPCRMQNTPMQNEENC